jgi:hypothetical protein
MSRPLALCCLLVALLPRPAVAEWQFVPMIGATFKGTTSLLDLENATGKVHRHFGGAVSLLGSGIFGAEALVVYTPAFFETDDPGFETPIPGNIVDITNSRTLAVMGNVVLTTPRRWTEYSLRPYVSGGLGLLHARSEDKSGVVPVYANMTGFNVGGGAVGFLTARTGVRFDFRYTSSLHRERAVNEAFGRTHLSYLTFSVGLVIRTGFINR